MEPTAAPDLPPASAADRAAAKAFDPDRTLAALLVPEPQRAALITLIAFAGEIDAIPDRVREPALGRIRLQWWRDVLAAAPDARSGHPVADRLRAAVARHALPPGLLLGLIDAGEFLLDHTPMPDRQHLGAYHVKTEGSLFALSARVLGQPEGSALERASAPAAQAVGAARRVVRFAAELARGRLLVDGLASNGHAVADLAADTRQDAIRARLAALAEEALARHAEALAAIGALEPGSRAAFLPVALVPPALAAWRRARIVPARECVVINPLLRAWRIWRAHGRWQAGRMR